MPLRPIRFLASELWTPIAMWRTNSMIRQRAIATGGPIAALSSDDLAKLIDAEWTRGKELDDKLQKLTAALSVSVTIGGLVGSTMLQDLVASGWKITAAVLFLLAAALLLTGVLIGFNGLRPKPRYGYGAGYLSIVAAGGDTARNEMIAAAHSFERDNLLRANEAVAAIVSIRNGVLVFASAMLVGLVAAGLGKADVSDRTVHAAKYESPALPDDDERILGSAASVNHHLPVGASSVPSANFTREGKRDAARSLPHNNGTRSPCDEVTRTTAAR